MRRVIEFTSFGLVFGFLLSRVGATDYDAIMGMFLLTDLHLMGVIGMAVVVLGLGLRMWQHVAPEGQKPIAPPKPFKPGLALGATLFGAGWALTGTCPGTALSQIGEGKVVALFTVLGIFLGSALYRRFGASLGQKGRVQRPGGTSSAPMPSASWTTAPGP